MSYADKVFKLMCLSILNNGVSSVGEEVRPHWEDGTEAHTLKKFCVVNRYDLSKEFPAITLRKVPIKSCTDEMLWIWQKKSNNINDLSSHVWDSWADENGTIGKAYGYQLGKLNRYKDITEEGLIRAFDGGEFKFSSEDINIDWCDKIYVNGKVKAYHVTIDSVDYWYMDQVNKVIYDLKTNPFSRRIITNLYNMSDLSEMALYPCAYMCTFNVTKKGNRLVLNMILNQRSQDVLAANAWNVCQYAVLQHMLARECKMSVGEFVHVIADCHIYDRHIDIIKDLIKREEYNAPKLWLNPNKNSFYSFDKDDIKLIDYKYSDFNEKIPVAI